MRLLSSDGVLDYIFEYSYSRFSVLEARESAENFPGGPTEKIPKINKKYRKIVLFSLFQGGGGGEMKKKIKKGFKNGFFFFFFFFSPPPPPPGRG